MDSKVLTKILEATKLKPGQIKVLSKLIQDYDEADTIVYELVGLLEAGVKYSSIKADLSAGNFEWNASFYKDLRTERENADSLLAKPLEVQEGEMECPKCKKKQTLVVEMQTRSADEGFTYFIHCFNPTCKKITKT